MESLSLNIIILIRNNLFYYFTSEFEYFDKAYEIQVFPHPNAPGMAQVPPKTEGNRESSTL